MDVKQPKPVTERKLIGRTYEISGELNTEDALGSIKEMLEGKIFSQLINKPDRYKHLELRVDVVGITHDSDDYVIDLGTLLRVQTDLRKCQKEAHELMSKMEKLADDDVKKELIEHASKFPGLYDLAMLLFTLSTSGESVQRIGKDK